MTVCISNPYLYRTDYIAENSLGNPYRFGIMRFNLVTRKSGETVLADKEKRSRAVSMSPTRVGPLGLPASDNFNRDYPMNNNPGASPTASPVYATTPRLPNDLHPLTYRETAKLLGVCQKTVENICRVRCEIPITWIGQKPRILYRDLVAYIERRGSKVPESAKPVSLME